MAEEATHRSSHHRLGRGHHPDGERLSAGVHPLADQQRRRAQFDVHDHFSYREHLVVVIAQHGDDHRLGGSLLHQSVVHGRDHLSCDEEEDECHQTRYE